MTIILNEVLKNGAVDCNFMTVHMQQYPFIFSDERKWRIRRHLAFWTFWWLFQAVLYSALALPANYPWLDQLAVSSMESFCFMPNHIFLGYTLMYFIIPRFLLKQKYWLTGLWTLAAFLVTAVISSAIGIYVIPELKNTLFNYTAARPTWARFHLAMMAGLRGGITIGGIAAAIKLMKYWYVKEQRNLQLQKENVEAQLQILKAQVHPHFLFNTLNNIYSHTQNTSPEAAKMVTGLSELLRFMLYEATQPTVPLSKELKMIQDYINLEKVRYGNKLELHLDIPDSTYDLHIAPLLLLPLVENCFKHGTSQILEQPWISLHVGLNGRQMQMKLLNGKLSKPHQESSHTGIGIKNVEKRLALLYPGKHELSITNEDEVFIVNLKIELEQKKEVPGKPVSQSQLTHA
jgi:sensor histidine kinase YesM